MVKRFSFVKSNRVKILSDNMVTAKAKTRSPMCLKNGIDEFAAVLPVQYKKGNPNKQGIQHQEIHQVAGIKHAPADRLIMFCYTQTL
jgi:intein-encoded DNA endonuclease-like protein